MSIQLDPSQIMKPIQLFCCPAHDGAYVVIIYLCSIHRDSGFSLIAQALRAAPRMMQVSSINAALLLNK